MGSLIAVLLLIGGGFLLAVQTRRTREDLLAQRVDLVTRTPARRRARPPASERRGLAWIRAFFAFGMRRDWAVPSANSLHLLLAGAAGALGGWLLVRAVTGPSVAVAAILAAAGFYLLPRLMLIRQRRRAEVQFAEMLPDGIDMVVRIVRAGLPVAAAIRTVGREAEPPLSTVFARVADQHGIGVALDEALAQTSAAVGNPDFGFFAVAIALQQTTGGNIATTLEALSEIIRKRRAIRLKAAAATAEVRISAIVLGGIPFFVASALMLLAPQYLEPLFRDPRGQIILGSALLFLLLGGFTMRTMIRHGLQG